MIVAWGVVVTVLSLLAWGGQLVVTVNPPLAVRLGLLEKEEGTDRTFWNDAVGEARWDVMVLWTMVVAGLLMVTGHDAWPEAALVGSGMFLYFAGRGVVVRLLLMRRAVAIGTAESVRVGLAALVVWGVMAFVTIVIALSRGV